MLKPTKADRGGNDMTDLATRIEQASGPGELAKDIFRAVFPEKVPDLGRPNDYGWREDYIGWWLQTGEDQRTPRQRIDPPNWLGSIDAAMTLIPEGCDWTLSVEAYAPCLVTIPSGDDRVDAVHGHGATPALALCAAAIRARS